MTYLPKLVSERQAGGHWDRCLESSFEMLSDKMSRGTQVVSALRLEAAIPNAGNGSNVAENMAAIDTLYPSFPTDAITAFRDPASMPSLLVAGNGFALVGDYGQIPKSLSRWDPAFAAEHPAGHAVYVQRDGPGGAVRWDAHAGRYVWWMDPLATDGYPGEWVEYQVVLDFLNGNTCAYALEGSAGLAQGDNPMLPITDPRAGTVRLTEGEQLYDLNAKPLVKVSSAPAPVSSPFGTTIGKVA